MKQKFLGVEKLVASIDASSTHAKIWMKLNFFLMDYGGFDVVETKKIIPDFITDIHSNSKFSVEPGIFNFKKKIIHFILQGKLYQKFKENLKISIKNLKY